jgi:FkbM family methyltransferase
MKRSLQQAISVFPYKEQLHLYFLLVCQKAGFNKMSVGHELLAECQHYVQLIENGVAIKRKKNGLLEFVFLINGKSCIFFVRRYSSDARVFETVILHEEYKSAKEHLVLQKKPRPVIIDAGGNVGFTTIYLHAFFPEAKFIIIEPDAANYQLLQKNITINHIERVTLLEHALWVNEDGLVIDDSFRDGQEWSLTVRSAGSIPEGGEQKKVSGVTLASLCTKAGNEQVDLLKIDVEGAERFLFKDVLFISTIEKHVKNLVIEIHDEYTIRPLIFDTMHNLGFGFQEFGDVTLFFRN